MRMRWNQLVIRFTAPLWNWVINRTLCRAYAAGVISSQQLHVLTREFDPTQDGTIGRLIAGRRVEPYAFEQKAA